MERKSTDKNDTKCTDELYILCDQHVLLVSSIMIYVAQAQYRLGEESKLRSSICREQIIHIAEMIERVSGMHSAIRKVNEILLKEKSKILRLVLEQVSKKK